MYKTNTFSWTACVVRLLHIFGILYHILDFCKASQVNKATLITRGNGAIALAAWRIDNYYSVVPVLILRWSWCVMMTKEATLTTLWKRIR